MALKNEKKLKRVVDAVRTWTSRVVNLSVTTVFELVLERSGTHTFKYPPIFVLGTPRSGSTVLFQVLTDAYEVGYISNAHCRWFGAPALAEMMNRPLNKKQPSDFTSKHGLTSRDSDPAECGDWWYRFFRRKPAYITKQDVSPRKMRAFRRSILSLERAFDKPVVFKNLYAGLRLEPLIEYIPEAVFVVIERNTIDNAQSILRGRYDVFGTYEPWWSVPPPDLDRLVQRSPVGQVVGQIRSINALLKRDLARLGASDRTFRIRYEDFCQDVHGKLEEFEAFMRSQGVKLKRRFDVPRHFEVSQSVRIPNDLYDELCRYVEERKAEDKSAVAHPPGQRDKRRVGHS